MLNPCILVVGHRLLCTFLCNSLQAGGYTIHLAKNGRGALDIVQYGRIDLVLIDATLSDTKGHLLCAELRKQMDAPIILLQESHSLDDIVAGLTASADEHILMPFQFGQVEACIARLLKDRPGPSALQR